MKQPGEKLQETFTGLNGRTVVDYLIKSPEFFIRSARIIEAIRMPYPVHGTVSLVEWRITHARSHIHALEENIVLLTEQAIANKGLFYRLLYLQRSLTATSSLDDILARFHHWACDLGLAGAGLCLFPDRQRLDAPSNHTHLALSRQSLESLRIQCLGQEQRYLGPLNRPELLVMLPEAKVVGSAAMLMLGSDANLGVMLFTSRDASHYQQGQGMQLLHEIALMLPELLECQIEHV